MKKKIVISIIVVLILVIGIVSFILFNNSITTTITLDINPSIEINLTRNKKIKNVVALNDTAKISELCNMISCTETDIYIMKTGTSHSRE